VNAGDVALAAARAGRGLARALSYQVVDDLAAGRLRRVLQAWEPPPIPVHLVYPEGRKAAAKVRAFVDYAAARLRSLPALQEA
jgi:DNA-binding transcriptional LysR family regulator